MPFISFSVYTHVVVSTVCMYIYVNVTKQYTTIDLVQILVIVVHVMHTFVQMVNVELIGPPSAIIDLFTLDE